MSPLQLRYEAWESEHRRLLTYLDAQPNFHIALIRFRQYHELTEFLKENPHDIQPVRCWRPSGGMRLDAYGIERRTLRFRIKDKQPPQGITPAFGGCPLAVPNLFWQQAGKQFPYPKSVNGNLYNWLVQLQPFGREHFTIPSAHPEQQDWRPSLTLLYRRLVDRHAIAAMLGCLVLYNGVKAGAGIAEWFHMHALRAPDEGPLPIQQAIALAPRAEGPVTRIDEPHWPLPAYRITGSAEAMAGEVLKLARRSTDVAGDNATESIAMYVQEGAVVCIFVPRDRRREWVEEFGGNLGAFEAATGSLVFSDPERIAKLRDGEIGFDALWGMLAAARPGWSDDL